MSADIDELILVRTFDILPVTDAHRVLNRIPLGHSSSRSLTKTHTLLVLFNTPPPLEFSRSFPLYTT